MKRLGLRVVGALSGASLAGVAFAASAPAASGAFRTPAWVWAGQVFDLAVAWKIDWAKFGNLDGPLTWASDRLVTEPFGPPAVEPLAPGASDATITLHARAMAPAPGKLHLAPANQNIVMKTGVIRMDEDDVRAVSASIPVQTAKATLDVRPLPPAPAGFSGAVGRFTVTSKVSNLHPRLGEDLDWTISVAGIGNWPAIRSLPSRQVSRDFDVAGPPVLKEDPQSTLFERTLSERVTLSPQRAGRYTLSGFDLVAFDPKDARYVTVHAAPVDVEVLPGPGGVIDLRAGATGPRSAAPSEPPLPRLMQGRGHATAPPPEPLWVGGLAAAPLVLLLSWIALAVQRAWERDPERGARAAHHQLASVLTRLSRATKAAERRRLVRAWQTHAARRWNLDAAPTPGAFSASPDWRRLWGEADLFLYGRAGALPYDWTERAAAALAELGAPPPFRLATTLRPGRLLPAACAAVVVAAGLAWSGPVPAAEPSEPVFRAAVARDPLDWRARFNLAVTLAARKRWEEAAGQAAVAWAQRPRAPETRALWDMTADKAGYSTEPGASVPHTTGWTNAIATRASPAAWRWLALCLAWIACGGVTAAAVARYGKAPAIVGRLGLAAAAATALGAASAGAALRSYGPLSSPEAVLVWRAVPLRPLPVDTPADEEPVQLAPGAAGRVDRAFLGWREVRFAGGRSGWVRQEDLIWAWRRPH